jgi:hypothetical protein
MLALDGDLSESTEGEEMLAPNQIDPSDPLAPSELVLLRGEQFAQKARFGNVELLDGQASVSPTQLGQAILSAAILASEQVGTIGLEVRSKKAMLGLRTVAELLAQPTAGANPWPPGSLEHQLQPLAKRLRSDSNAPELHSVLYAWLEEDSASPWQTVLDRVSQGLASRNLLTAVEEKQLKVFTVTRYQLPESTAALASHQALEPIQKLKESCTQERPEIWKLLEKAIKTAIKARTEQDSSPDMDF